MSTQINNVRIALRHDTLERWTQANPLLLQGEYAAVVLPDSSVRIKIGDGEHTFNELPYEGQYLAAGNGIVCHDNIISINDNIVALKTDFNNYYNKNETSSSTELDDAFSKCSNVTLISGDTPFASDLSVVKITNDDYNKLVVDGAINESALYVIADDHTSFRGQQIKDVAEPTDDNDAATKKYVDDSISNIPKPDLSEYYKKTETSSSSEISDRFDSIIKVGSYLGSDGYSLSSSDLSVVKISEDDYMRLVTEEQQDDKVLYVVSSDNLNAKDERVINVAEPIMSSDAATKEYVDNLSTIVELSSYAHNHVAMVNNNGQVYSNSLSVYKITRQKYIELVNDGKESESAVYVITDPGINAYNQRISCVADPVNDTDAVNKRYVDASDAVNKRYVDGVKRYVDGVKNVVDSKHIIDYTETAVIAEDEDGNEFTFTIFTKGLN